MRGGDEREHGEQENRRDQQQAEIFAVAARPGADRLRAPDLIQRLLHAADQRNRGVEKTHNAGGAEHGDLGVADEADDLLGESGAPGAERLEGFAQEALDQGLDAESLEHREGHREQRHHRHQRPVTQRGGAQAKQIGVVLVHRRPCKARPAAID